jgi:hypothetical protein
MNIRALANRFTQVTNRNIPINWIQSNGYTTNDAGKRFPKTITMSVQAQVQALSGSDLLHTDGLNMQGVMRSVYMYGNAVGVVRADKLGGDILVFPECLNGCNKNWLITKVVETWPDWCHVVVTLQVN